MANELLSHSSLLVGVPLDKSAFGEQLEASDYLASFNPVRANKTRAEVEQAIDESWEEYEQNLEFILEMVEIASSRGMQVNKKASLKVLERETATREFVFLFGHWKGWQISNDDIDPALTIEIIEEGMSGHPNDLSEAYFTWCSENDKIMNRVISWFEGSPELTTRRVLENTIRNFRPLPTRGVDKTKASAITYLSNGREQLDELFADYVKPGNRLELVDGLHAKEVIGSAINANFDGVLDLSACNSMILADYLNQNADGRFRTVHFPKTVHPKWGAKALSHFLTNWPGDRKSFHCHRKDSFDKTMCQFKKEWDK